MGNRRKLTFHLKDRPDLVEALRILAARERTSQRAILIDALQAYFAHRQENRAFLDVANCGFSEWDNEEDRIYDTLCSSLDAVSIH